MNKRIEEREQEPECAIQRHQTADDVAKGRHELARHVGRLLARRWLKEQCPTESSSRSTSIDKNGASH